jgi:ankyrin repeat protein
MPLNLVIQSLLKKLLANKADITLKDKSGKTALDYAKLNGNAEIIALMTSASTPPTLPVEGKDKTKKKKSKKSK